MSLSSCVLPYESSESTPQWGEVWKEDKNKGFVMEFGSVTGSESAFKFKVLKPSKPKWKWMDEHPDPPRITWVQFPPLSAYRAHSWKETHLDTAYEAVSADCPFPFSVLSGEHWIHIHTQNSRQPCLLQWEQGKQLAKLHFETLMPK